MEDKPFPELSLKAKRLIYWGSITLFVLYSVCVYTYGTEYSRGAENYTASAKLGKLVFQKYNCCACHQLYGLGGYMGPDLTNVMTTAGKGRDYANAMIRLGSARMPQFNMSDEDVNNLLDYLEYVGHAGMYPVTDYRTTWYGDINPEPN